MVSIFQAGLGYKGCLENKISWQNKLLLFGLCLLGLLTASFAYSTAASAASLTVQKHWVNSLNGHRVTIPATTGGTNNTSQLISDSAAGGGNTSVAGPVSVSPGNTVVFGAEIFFSGNPDLYTAIITCTGNTNPLSGSDGMSINSLLIDEADVDIICTYTNTYHPPEPGTEFCDCDGLGILSQGEPDIGITTLKFVNLETGSVTTGPVVQTLINAIGYNVLDNYLYASDFSHRELIKIDSAGGVTPLGVAPSLMPGLFAGSAWGTVHNGVYYSYGNAGAARRGFGVDLSTLTVVVGPTPLILGGVPPTTTTVGADIVYVNGKLYSVGYTNGVLHLISSDPTTFAMNDEGPVIGIGLPVNGFFAAAYFDRGNIFYAQDARNNGNIWRFDVSTREATLVSSISVVSNNNDGTSCRTETFADYGDAPASYGEVSNIIGGYDPDNHVSYLMLGSLIDGELSQLYSANATGDNTNDVDDEEGFAGPSTIFMGSAKNGGKKITLDVNHTNTSQSDAAIAGWIDFNGNGVFDTNERSDVVTVPSGGTASSLTWTVPANSKAGASFMRLRIFEAGITDPSPTGTQDVGETEDYQLTLTTSDKPEPVVSQTTTANPEMITVVSTPDTGVKPLSNSLGYWLSSILAGSAMLGLNMVRRSGRQLVVWQKWSSLVGR